MYRIKELVFFYQEEIKKSFSDLKNKEKRYKQLPNILTISRALVILPITLLLLTKQTTLMMIACGIIALSSISDFIDGRVARKYKITSKLGSDLDAFCDKLYAIGLTMPLIISKPILISIIGFEGVISGLNIAQKIKCNHSESLIIGKIKTWFLSASLFAGYISLIMPISEMVISSLFICTMGLEIATTTEYINRNNKTQKLIENEKKVSLMPDSFEEKTALIKPINNKNKIKNLKKLKEEYQNSNEELTKVSILTKKKQKRD